MQVKVSHSPAFTWGASFLGERAPAILLPLFGHDDMRHRQRLRRSSPAQGHRRLGRADRPAPVGPPTAIVTNPKLVAPQTLRGRGSTGLTLTSTLHLNRLDETKVAVGDIGRSLKFGLTTGTLRRFGSWADTGAAPRWVRSYGVGGL